MTEEDLKAVVAKYQQKSFELFNSNVVLEVQIESLKRTIQGLNQELEKLKRSKKGLKIEEEF